MVDIASTAFDSNLLEREVRKIARSSDETKKLARRRLAQARIKAPGASELDLRSKAVKAIVRGRALRSGVACGGTGLIGAIPGVGTAAAISAGVTAAVILRVKVNVDMYHVLVYVFKPDMEPEEAFSLAVTLAFYGTLEKQRARKFGGAATRLASQAGVRVVRQQLRGRAAGDKTGLQARRHRVHPQGRGESRPVRGRCSHRKHRQRRHHHIRGAPST